MPAKYENTIIVATLYKFVEINDLQTLRSKIQNYAKKMMLKEPFY